jgi:quinoprotein glucose dehydrogenase
MAPNRKTQLAGVGIACLLVLAGGCEDAPPPVPGGGSVATWTAYGGTPGGTHYSSATQITPENVAWLEPAWEHRSGDIRMPRGPSEDGPPISANGFQATPIVIEDTLYYCSPFNKVFALNAETGEEKWRFDPEVDHATHILPNCRGVSSWRSGKAGLCEHRIFVGTLDARLIALDAETGLRCEDFGAGGEVDVTHRISEHQPIEYSITSPPVILNDLAITGSLVLDNTRTDAPSGVVRAYDVRTGAQRWAWNPVPEGMEGMNEDGTYRSGTTNVWSIIAVDEDRDLVFVPTGNTNPDYFGGHRQGLDHYSSSVVALHGATGEVAWHFQMVHHDLWDYDTPAQPTLMDLRLDGETIPVVVQVTKMGMTFVLHRETGEPVFPVEERPVPQDPVAGEYLSPTQPFPSHVPHLLPPITEEDAWGFTFVDEGACRDRLSELRNDGIYTPPSLGGSVLYPSNGGGNNWGARHPPGRAADGGRHLALPRHVEVDSAGGVRRRVPEAARHALLRGDGDRQLTPRRAVHGPALGHTRRHRPRRRRDPLERPARHDPQHGPLPVLVDQGRTRRRRSRRDVHGARVHRRGHGARPARP